jgi:hypothetical protein
MGFVIFAIALMNYFFGGFVFMKIWDWFPSEIFNLVSISYVESLGLLIFISFFMNKNFNLPSKDKDQENEQNLYRVICITVWLLFTLGFGFILQAAFMV